MQIITGNDLKTGLVVFLAADGGWTTALPESLVLADEAEAKTALALVETTTDRQVVAPYLIDIVSEDGALRPARFRETIRAEGPTIPSDFSETLSERD